MDWKAELEWYENFMGWDNDRRAGKNLPEHKARERLKEHLEFVIGTNGWGELYDRERELAEKLGIDKE